LIETTDGRLCGVTAPGGFPSDHGSIFKLNRDGTGHTIVHRFTLSAGDGATPQELIAASDGLLYGTTAQGGAFGSGTVYRMNRDRSGYTILHHFTLSENAEPLGGVIEASDGRLYGALSGCGVVNTGAVYRLSKDGTGYAVLRSFGELEGCPNEVMEGMDGFLYGTTFPGSPKASGTVFRLSKDGGTFTVLRTFGGTDGGPAGRLIEGPGGILHGLTRFGGVAQQGTVYKLNMDGSACAVLHTFDTATGAYPFGLVAGPGGTLYGATSGGGLANKGTVYRLNTKGSGHTVLHSFSGLDGDQPLAGVLPASDGLLYGTTSAGGTAGKGVVFGLSVDGGRFTVLHGFGGRDGAGPFAGLIQTGDGSMYGTTAFGGDLHIGVVYRLNVVPPLSVRLTPANTVLLSWPAGWNGFELQQNPDLSTGNWTTVGIPPILVAGEKLVNVGVPNGRRFFRLYMP